MAKDFFAQNLGFSKKRKNFNEIHRSWDIFCKLWFSNISSLIGRRKISRSCSGVLFIIFCFQILPTRWQPKRLPRMTLEGWMTNDFWSYLQKSVYASFYTIWLKGRISIGNRLMPSFFPVSKFAFLTSSETPFI